MRSLTEDRPFLTACLLLGAGFALEACGGAAPETVAERFWEAARDRDVAAVEALSIPAEGVSLDFDDEGTELGAIELGDAEVEGGRAEVATSLEVTSDERDMDLAFSTVLLRRDGEWLVDLGETGDQLVGAVLGTTMQELGEAPGEGMREAMEGMAEDMAEGMAEGMKAMGEAFESAAEEMARDSSR